MPRSYNISFLSPKNAALAYPLVQSAIPKVTLDDWLAYTAHLSQPAESRESPTGVVALENSRGYIHGLFSFCKSFGLGLGPVMNIENFIALDTGDRAAVVTKLIDTMEDLAQDHGCTAIHTHLPEHWVTGSPGRTSLIARLVDAGHDRDTVKLSKSLGAG